MIKDVETDRVVIGFSKIPDEDGDYLMEVEYNLKPIALSYLQKIFNIDPKHSDPIERNMIYCYRINQEQARALQPYVIDGVIDLEKYRFMLDCYAKE